MTAADPEPPPERPAIVAVDVRMYRMLLGDCFLITVTREKDPPAHILIDCGVLQGTPDGAHRMKDVAADIAATCATDEGATLDLAVVTHEHWDHVSGFGHAWETFASFKCEQLWMAWTEDPADPDGRQLQERFGKAHTVLRKLGATRTGLVPLDDEAKQGLFGFLGPMALDKAPDEGGKAAEQGAKADAGKRGTELIYERLRKWAGEVRYLSPGMVVEAPGGLKTYVLAPPRDQKALFKALDDKETYLAPNSEDADQLREAQRHSPFSPRFRWKTYGDIRQAADAPPPSAEQAKELKPERWVADQYFGMPGLSRRDRDDRTRRQIDDSYAVQLNRLALRMDRSTNNSSLVLAFELPGEDRATMLFAADAQVGNWLSWGAVKFAEKVPGRRTERFTGHELLARARLYKVGHHGSHNATMKARGLELMLRDDMVAMIPTDAAFALTQGKGWQMPNPRVNDALRLHAKGGILRGDDEWPDPTARAVAEGRVRTGGVRTGDAEDQKLGPLWVEFRAYGKPWAPPPAGATPPAGGL